MTPSEQRKAIQVILKDGGFYSGPIDGDFGVGTFAGLRELDLAQDEHEEDHPLFASNLVKASSFADPADVRAFRACIRRGGSEQQCFKVGDNGIGLWGDDTTQNIPMCALPPEDWLARWGTKAAARGAGVVVTVGDREVRCELRDTMPHKANIKNGAGIDLNPAACKALGLTPPIMVTARWRWA